MDGTNPNVIKNITEKRTDWTKRINKDVEIRSINEEKEMVIERYEKVLNILKGVPIWNEEDLDYIKFTLDRLESYLAYIPNGPFFNDVIPTEMKENILSYLCDCNAFISASVCQEWKTILENRIKEKQVITGEDWPKCQDKGCMNPDCEDMLKAVATHKLDVHLVFIEPVTEINKELVTDAITSVSKFTVQDKYTKGDDFFDDDLEGDDEFPILSIHQFEHFFENISKGDKVMQEVKLINLNLQNLNQERLANVLVSKIKKLTLDEVALDVETFIAKFQQDSVNLTLTQLTNFDFLEFPDYGANVSLGTIVADALCKVEKVKLCGWTFVFIKSQLMGRLMENILRMPITMKTLTITMKTLMMSVVNVQNLRFYCPDFESLINPQDLKTVFNKMTTLQLEGFFTVEQLEAIRSLPNVEVSRVPIKNSEEFFHSIKKGSSGMF